MTTIVQFFSALIPCSTSAPSTSTLIIIFFVSSLLLAPFIFSMFCPTYNWPTSSPRVSHGIFMSSFDPSFEFLLIPFLACGRLQRILVNQLLIYEILLDYRRYSLGDTICICTYLSYFICIFKLTLFCICLYKWTSSTPQSVVVLQIF